MVYLYALCLNAVFMEPRPVTSERAINSAILLRVNVVFIKKSLRRQAGTTALARHISGAPVSAQCLIEAARFDVDVLAPVRRKRVFLP